MAAVTALSMTTTAFADEPYNSYNYDTWDDPVPSQSVYRVEATITGAEMQLDRLRDRSDPLFYDEEAAVTLSDASDMSWDDDRNELWIADTKNNRIIVLDEDGIRERGKHKELIKQGGLYEKYYTMQLGAV